MEVPPPIPPPVSQPMALGNPGGGGGGGPTSPVITAGGGGGGGGPASPVVITVGGGGGGGSSLPDITAGPSIRGTNLASGYVATGGGTSTGGGGISPAGGGGGGDPQIQTSGSIPGTSTAPTVYTPGKFTYLPPSGGSIPETLNITYGSSGGVGASANLSVSSTVGTPTNISWQVTGATPQYSGNTFSTTPGALQWNHPTYTPPPAVAGSSYNKSITFFWGEKPGADTVTVSASIKLTGGGSIQGTPTATAKITVASPTVFWVLDYEPNVRTSASLLTYSYYNSTTEMTTPGIKWAFSNYGSGSEAVEQLLTNAVWYEATDSTGHPAASWSGPASAQGTPAPFPLVDQSSGATLPWYDSTPADGQDSPTMPLTEPNATYATMDEYFTDDVMYNPGGIFVPVAQFSWEIEATATGSGITWAVSSGSSAGPSGSPSASTTWPQTAMAYPANDYNQFVANN